MSNRKISIISFTKRGAEQAAAIHCGLKLPDTATVCYTMKKDLEDWAGQRLTESLGEWTRSAFQSSEAIVFVGAAGIAVRAIAPCVKSKETDPAVIVVDELGIHVISLLSGHIGGANELTVAIADILQATPVITTATDINNLFSVDQWAAQQRLYISDMKLAKAVAAALLEGKKVGFYSDVPVRGAVPKGLVLCGGDGVPQKPEDAGLSGADRETKVDPVLTPGQPLPLGVAVTWSRHRKPFADTLQLIPQMVTLGMGCRKDIPCRNVEALLEAALETAGIAGAALAGIASIDLKAKEQALLAAAESRGLPFQVFTAEALSEAAGEFSPSDFVRGVTGVDNVCERAAILGSGNGTLILKKMAKDGVTAAAAIRETELIF